MAAAGFAANVLSYAVLLAAARLLAPADYGELVTLLGLLLVATVPALALQTVTARRIATSAPEGLRGATVAVAGGGLLVLAVAAIPLAIFLRLGYVATFLVAGAVPGTVAVAAAQGIAQGRRSFGTLAGVIGIAALARSGAGLGGLALGHSAPAAMAATFLATTAVGAVAFARTSGAATRHGPAWPVLREWAHAAHAHGALYLLAAADLFFARHVLATDPAAIYSAGAVLSRVTLWLPQAVAVLLFPAFTETSRRRALLPRAALVVVGVDAVVLAAALALPHGVARVIGGAKYPALAGPAWIFAVLGCAGAVLQLAVLAGLAVRRWAPVLAAEVAIAAEAVAILWHPPSLSVTGVAARAAIIVAVAAVGALALALGRAAPALRAAAGAAPAAEAS